MKTRAENGSINVIFQDLYLLVKIRGHLDHAEEDLRGLPYVENKRNKKQESENDWRFFVGSIVV